MQSNHVIVWVRERAITWQYGYMYETSCPALNNGCMGSRDSKQWGEMLPAITQRLMLDRGCSYCGHPSVTRESRWDLLCASLATHELFLLHWIRLDYYVAHNSFHLECDYSIIVKYIVSTQEHSFTHHRNLYGGYVLSLYTYPIFSIKRLLIKAGQNHTTRKVNTGPRINAGSIKHGGGGVA